MAVSSGHVGTTHHPSQQSSHTVHSPQRCGLSKHHHWAQLRPESLGRCAKNLPLGTLGSRHDSCDKAVLAATVWWFIWSSFCHGVAATWWNKANSLSVFRSVRSDKLSAVETVALDESSLDVGSLQLWGPYHQIQGGLSGHVRTIWGRQLSMTRKLQVGLLRSGATNWWDSWLMTCAKELWDKNCTWMGILWPLPCFQGSPSLSPAGNHASSWQNDALKLCLI